jgi:hypothetical protein
MTQIIRSEAPQMKKYKAQSLTNQMSKDEI